MFFVCQLPLVFWDVHPALPTHSSTESFRIDTPLRKTWLKALTVLQLDPDDLRCAYSGDKATEWDHLRPLISGQEPTGYISEIQNLVPVCGKCNQSKGNSHWRSWMEGNAKLCPRV